MKAIAVVELHGQKWVSLSDYQELAREAASLRPKPTSFTLAEIHFQGSEEEFVEAVKLEVDKALKQAWESLNRY